MCLFRCAEFALPSTGDKEQTELSHLLCNGEGTDDAYVEPACVVPSRRGKGIAKAMLYKALNRVGICGAETAYVISDMDFYKHLGFREHSSHLFYQKAEYSQKPARDSGEALACLEEGR